MRLVIAVIIVFILHSLAPLKAWPIDKNINQGKSSVSSSVDCKFDASQISQIVKSIDSLKNNEKWYVRFFKSFIEACAAAIPPFLFGLCAWGIIKIFFDTASVKIIFDEKDESCKRIFSSDNKITDIDYRIKVLNSSKWLRLPFLKKNIIARKCSIRITLPDIRSDEVKECEKAYIQNKGQFTSITNEYLLWDFNYEGKNPYIFDIEPQCHDMAAFAKYRDNNGLPYWEIPSENIDKPKICLNRNELKLEIKVYGENINPTKKEILLKMPLMKNVKKS